MAETLTTEVARPRALIASVRLGGVSEEEHAASVAEIKRLVDTLGFDVVAQMTQLRAKLDPGTVFGKGKLGDLARYTGGTGVVVRGPPKVKTKVQEAYDEAQDDEDVGEPLPDEDDEPYGDEVVAPPGGPVADVIVVDHELSPQQLRNLEKACACEVIDRTGVIVEIFHRHAKSREAKLQVEIARLNYLAPRLRETTGQRQRGGIGQKGAGESGVELDRRKIRDRLCELKDELEAIQGESDTRRARRKDAFRVALVGYTNAGKSSLMRALTGSEVYVADKLFATLDTTVRALWPETKPRILVSDTVGFIKKLPHDLVASFRSTLDEAGEASLLLHVVDAADPDFRDQMRVTREVLGEIKADDVPRRLVLNKADRVDEAGLVALAAEFPDALIVSAKTPEGLKTVRDAVVAFFNGAMIEAELFVRWDQQNVVGAIHELNVLSEVHEDEGTRFMVRALASAVDRIKGLLA